MATNPLSIGQRQEAQFWRDRMAQQRRDAERDFWEKQAESLLIEAFNETLAGQPAERQRIIDELRTKDDAELGRLVRENLSPYLEHELERVT